MSSTGTHIHKIEEESPKHNSSPAEMLNPKAAVTELPSTYKTA